MKKTSLLFSSLALIALINFSASAAPESWYNKTSKGVKDTYVGFGLGGEFYAGDAYDNSLGSVDPRFRLQFEGAWKVWSLPISLSFGDDAIVVAFNPRFQYWFHPFSGALAKLGIAPAVGPTFAYTSYDVGGGQGYDAISLGLGLSGVLKYDIMPEFAVMFTPIGMDFGFFRSISYTAATGLSDDTNSDFGFVYMITLAGAYNF